MTRVLIVGLVPESVDFSDPALPPGMTAEKIHAGIQAAAGTLRERGWAFDQCMILADETAAPAVERALGEAAYDCIVIGAGVRFPPRYLGLLEQVINAARRAAPNVPIAFNTRPEDTAEAAARWITA
jgi:NADPH-dependent ferric siderophore reductase